MTEKESQKWIAERDKLGKELELFELKEHVKHLKRELNEARGEVDALKQIVAIYESTTVKQQLTVSPEPSRLEIAAMLYARNKMTMDVEDAVVAADALILQERAMRQMDERWAAAKEVTK
jgi:hypothetical protein